MSLREDMWKYEQITGESAEHVPIIKLGAFLDGYEKGWEEGRKAFEAQPTNAVKCDCTTEEIAKSFIKDVESVKDRLDGQLCDDAVSREQVEEITFQEPSYTDPYNILTEVREKVRALPSVTPERPKGKWIDVNGDKSLFECSKCGDKVCCANNNYCPNCGAEMSGGGEG